MTTPNNYRRSAGRNQANLANAVAKSAEARAADPDHLRTKTGEVNLGADYTAAEVEFLKRVDRLKRTVRFPTATDYFRLAREALEGKADG